MSTIFVFCSRESGHVKANRVNSSCSSPVGDDNLAEEDSDPYIYGVDATDITEVPTDDVLRTNEQKVASSPRENEKLISKKRLNKLSSKKFADQFDPTNEVADSHSKNLSSSVVEDDCKRQGSRSKRASNAEKSHTAAAEQEPPIDLEACGLPSISLANSKKQQQKRKTKTSSRKENGEFTKASSKPKSLKRNSSRRREVKENRCDTKETSVAEMSEASLQEESDMGLEGNLTDIKENINPKKSKRHLQGEGALGDAKLQKDPEKKKGNKKNKSIEFEEESDEVSPEESPRNTTRMNTKRKKKDSLHSGDEENTNKDRSCKKTSKAYSDDNEATDNCKQFEPDNSTEELKLNMKTSVGGTPSTMDKATVIKEDDEPLGDMSFLIEVNSKISFFVSDTSTVECELKPMTARERNDVYKVAQLYKVHARIGTKAENNLTTVRLSKQADTKIPKPGSVDRLLSELSIAASKESPKNQVKRKYSATVVDNKQTGDGDVLDQDGPPKKRLSRQSRTNKV